VFAFKEKNAESLEFVLRVSYLEVYNEEINDLLTPGETGQNLKIIAEDPQKGAVIENLVEEVVSTREAVLQVIKTGEGQRSYGATNMNATSSRSHTLFRLVIESHELFPNFDPAATFDGDLANQPGGFTKLTKEASTGKGAMKVSFLNLVDLAGSERQKSTGAAGSQLKVRVEGARAKRGASKTSKKKNGLLPSVLLPSVPRWLARRRNRCGCSCCSAAEAGRISGCRGGDPPPVNPSHAAPRASSHALPRARLVWRSLALVPARLGWAAEACRISGYRTPRP
jgi:hypothetical protein